MLIETARVKRIRAGKINDFNFRVLINVEEAGFFIDGNAGIVANFLTQPCQGIKQRRFAGIGIANECDSQRLLQLLEVCAKVVVWNGSDKKVLVIISSFYLAK